MTQQEKKAYLARYRDNEKEILRLEEEIARWKSRGEAAAVIWRDMPRGNAENCGAVQQAVEEISQLEASLQGRFLESVRLRKEIGRAVAAAPDLKCRMILTCRYIEGMKWEDIAARMHLDARWVLRLHRKALNSLTIESHLPHGL